MSPNDPSITCPECGAASGAGERFCASCGLVLPRRRVAAAAAPAPVAADRLRRQQDNRFVGRSQNTLGSIRALYGVLALVTGLLAILAWGAYIDRPDRSASDFLAITLLTATAGISIAGFLFFQANPFVWTVVLAALQTLNLAIKLVQVPQWSGLVVAVLAIQGLLVAALWSAVPITARVMKILRERAAEAKTAGKAAPLATRAATREMQDQTRALRTFGITAAVVFAAALLAAWLPYRASANSRAEAVDRARQAETEREQRLATRDVRAGELEATAAEFRSDWGKSDLERVKAYFEPEKRETLWPKIERLLEKRGWKDKLPALADAEVNDQGLDGFDVFFQIDDVERLKTRWSYVDGKWRLVRFMFSKL